jgi:hypothetical protein
MAEPAYNAGGLIDFDDTGGGNTSTNYTLPGSPQEPQGPPPAPPTQLPTNDTNVTAVSNPPNTTPNTILDNLSPVEEPEFAETIYVKVSDFNQNGTITLVGNYPQNFVDFPKYDLSPIRFLPDINFRFLLAIKETKTSSESVFYTSKRFYIELMNLYSKNKPYLPNYVIKQEKVVVIALDGIKELINDLHIKELNTFLNKIPTIVIKNVFEFSNYGAEPDYEINSTYDLDELVRYIDWVVSKPPANYNERLLAEDLIGEWVSNREEEEVEEIDDTTPPVDEPSNDNNTEGPFPPIGRKGGFIGEIVVSDFGAEFIWNGAIWVLYDSETGTTAGSGNQGAGSNGGGGDFEENGMIRE